MSSKGAALSNLGSPLEGRSWKACGVFLIVAFSTDTQVRMESSPMTALWATTGDATGWPFHTLDVDLALGWLSVVCVAGGEIGFLIPQDPRGQD